MSDLIAKVAYDLASKNRVKQLWLSGNPYVRNFLYTLQRAMREGLSTDIICAGDSLTANYPMFVRFFRGHMQRTLGDGGRGFIAFSSSAVYDDYGTTQPIGFGANLQGRFVDNFDPATDDIYAPSMMSALVTGSSYINLIDYTTPFDTGDVYYLKQPSGGSFQWGSGLNGTTTADMIPVSTANATKELGITSYNRFGSSFGGGHIQARSITANTRMIGVNIKRGTSGVRVHRLAHGGVRGRQIAQLDAAAYTSFISSMTRPILYILNVGMNDSTVSAIDADAYEADVRTILTRVRAANPQILIVLRLMNETSDTTRNTKLETYRLRLLQKVAVDYGALVWDTRNVIGNYSQAVAGGYMADTIHLSAKGGEAEGSALFNFLGGPALADISGALSS